MTVYFFLRSEVVGKVDDDASPPASPDKTRTFSNTASASKTALAVLTCSAVAATVAPVGSHATIALGLSYTILDAFAFLLVGKSGTEAKSGRLNGGASVIYSANGLLSHPGKSASSSGDCQMAVIREVSAVAALSTATAVFTLESFTFGGLAYWGVIGQAMGDQWVFGQGIVTLVYGIGMVGVHCFMYWAILVMVSQALRCTFLLTHPDWNQDAKQSRWEAAASFSSTNVMLDSTPKHIRDLVCSSFRCYRRSAGLRLLTQPRLVWSFVCRFCICVLR
jgi:hypothetical protein